MVEKRMLITRPNHDDVTHYLHAWGKEIIKAANRKGAKVFDLEQNKANRKTVLDFIEKNDPRFVVFNGHGDEKTIFGHQDGPLIQMNDASILQNKIIYSVSCKSAKKLGPECIRKGSLAFVGYCEDFVFYHDPHKISKPLTDKIAKPCLDSTTQVAVSIIKGNSASDAYQNSQARFKKWIKSFVKSKEPEAPWILQSLIYNMINQKALGNMDSFF